MSLVIDRIIQLHYAWVSFDLIFVYGNDVLAIHCFQGCFGDQAEHFDFTLNAFFGLGVGVEFILIINLDCYDVT